MLEPKPSGPALQSVDGLGTNCSNDAHTSIGDLFRIPERYLRSTHLERDFDDINSVSQYVVTPPTVASFSRIIEGLRPGSGHRAWRVTGDYGTGKSSFALILAHLLCDPTAPTVVDIRQAVEQKTAADVLDQARMLPVLVTGAQEPLVPAVARALERTLRRLNRQENTAGIIEELESRSASVVTSADPSQLVDLLDQVSSCAPKFGYSGVFLVLDELGKFLEYAALRPDEEDVYILQRLAEAAARSGECPFIVLSLLHQGFHAYAEGLPSTHRLEWEKVGGRYGEITFDQPLSHISALVKGSLNVDRPLIPWEVSERTVRVKAAVLETGWFGTSAEFLSPLDIYPLHPTVLPVLGRFFARFGQHERSLFSFLLSSEPFGLQEFARRPASEYALYRLSDFYDYVRSAFGNRLSGGSYRSHWLRISETIDRMSDLEDYQLMVLKTVAVLNVLDAEHLLATEGVIAAALNDGDETGAVSQAVADLKHRGLVFDRGMVGGYCLWPSTSVNLESAFEAAKRALGSELSVSAQLKVYLNQSSIVARRHYIETGTLRYFEIRYIDSTSMFDTVKQDTEGDGVIAMVLCDTLEERRTALKTLVSNDLASHSEVIWGVPPLLQSIAGQLLDAQSWQWVADNTPELNQDSYATAEVARQVAASKRQLHKSLDSIFGFRSRNSGKVEWWYRGEVVVLPDKGKLSAKVSDICDGLYHDAPRIRHELLNRRSLSSAAAAARLRLIRRMFSSPGEFSLGFEDSKAPPEKSMYLSVLSAGKVHREENGRFVLAEPPEEGDDLHLRPALTRILKLVERANGRRVTVPEIFEVLQGRPYGVRMGVAPLLLAITMVAHSHEIAVYENGTYLQKFDSPEFLRLTKQPSTFELQLCRVTGVRMEVFRLLTQIFAEEPSNDRSLELLDVVRPLSIFAAQLPEYTRRKTNLPDQAKSVRNALLKAREPATLVFEALPIACGFDPFPIAGRANVEAGRRFVEVLQGALSDLQSAYPKLLASIRNKINVSLGDGDASLDRAEITARASQVMLAAREPRLQVFARSLSDAALTDDPWAERIGSAVVSKPAARWTPMDEASAMDHIEELVQIFRRTEATAFGNGPIDPGMTAMRISLTSADGNEATQVIRVSENDEIVVQRLSQMLEELLDGTDRPELKYAAIAYLLKRDFVK